MAPSQPTTSTNNEIVTLSERSSTLDMLFHYIYRKPQPDITELSFEELSMLAEAAEKYHVYSAMEVCRILMRRVSSFALLRGSSC